MTETNTKEQKKGGVDNPSRQYFIPAQIVHNFSQKGRDHLNRKMTSQIVLSLQAGAFMAFGAAFSILLSMGLATKGLFHLMAGLGFAAGYAMVFLSGAILFTEVNILLPTYLFQKPSVMGIKIIRFWFVAYCGNIIGALFVGALMYLSKSLSPDFYQSLNDYINHHKMIFLSDGVWGFFEIVISGILANWLIGMAAFLTTASRDTTGKIIGTLLPVILFVAGNFQHSAANMGYFSIAIFSDHTYKWYQYFIYNLVPASLGNIIGGAIMVALMFSFAYNDEIQNRIKN